MCFFNMDILVNIAHTSFKFERCLLEIQIEGRVNFDLCHSFHLMKCRNFD